MRKPELAAIVLAGGKSSRMGSDKALLKPFGTKGATLLARSFALAAAFGPVYVASGKREYSPWPCIADQSGYGPAAGIHAGLKMAQKQEFAGILAIACDLPGLQPHILRKLIHAHAEFGRDKLATLYQDGENGRLEMLVAIYSVKCVDFFEKAFEEGETAPRKIIPANRQLRIAYGAKEKQFFMNCNTLNEFEAIKNKVYLPGLTDAAAFLA